MKSIEEANEYFENQQAISNLRSDYRDAIPLCKSCGKPESDPSHSKDYAFSGIVGAHAFEGVSRRKPL